MNKVIVIGIDALDSRILASMKDELPNLSGLMTETPDISFDGVFPPDSPTSWASIYTGLNPAKHGIVLFTDPLKRVSTMITRDVDDSSIRGRTFWDIAGRMGKRVCVLTHLLGYPVWAVNGTMIGRSGVTGDVQAYPQGISDIYDLHKFSWQLDLFPGRNRREYVKLAAVQLSREKELAIQLLNDDSWDLFFVSFGELDPIQYSFWNYYDKDDPSYPGSGDYEDVIPDFYKTFDEVIGEFLSRIPPETAMMIVSDHGIGSRPVRLLNVNEFIRRLGLLRLRNTSGGVTGTVSRKAVKMPDARQRVIEIIDRCDLGNIAASFLHRFPKFKEWFIASRHVDWENSSAYLTDQSGIKNYPYGGIMVVCRDGVDYDATRNVIIAGLTDIRDSAGRRIVEWIRRREDLYEGNLQDRYPDILFELRENYGAGSIVPAELFGESSSHNIAPGCHKQHHATFLVNSPDELRANSRQGNLMDIAPTILELLGIDTHSIPFDGRCLIK